MAGSALLIERVAFVASKRAGGGAEAADARASAVPRWRPGRDALLLLICRRQTRSLGS